VDTFDIVIIVIIVTAIFICGVIVLFTMGVHTGTIREANVEHTKEMAAMEARLNERLDAIDAEFKRPAWWEIRE